MELPRPRSSSSQRPPSMERAIAMPQCCTRFSDKCVVGHRNALLGTETRCWAQKRVVGDRNALLGIETRCWAQKHVVGLRNALLGTETRCWAQKRVVGHRNALLGTETRCWAQKRVVGHRNTLLGSETRCWAQKRVVGHRNALLGTYSYPMGAAGSGPRLLFLALMVLAYVDCMDKTFRVACQTTKGPLLIEVYPDWAPIGARRFLELVLDGFYTNIAFFRCVKGFLTQFGISERPEMQHWHRANIPDDPNIQLGIKKHYISYAGGGPNTRSTQLFIAFEDLDFLGNEPWETPFGRYIHVLVVLDVVHTVSIYIINACRESHRG
jgi:cyclophilin family peptidyl-prolyl cis-trans isomerase